MGLSGWAAIIPLYGDYCLYDRIWGKGLLVLVIQIVAALIFSVVAMAIGAATYCPNRHSCLYFRRLNFLWLSKYAITTNRPPSIEGGLLLY